MSNTEYSNEFLARMFGAYMPCNVRSKRSGKMYKASGINYLSESSIKCLLCDEIWLYPKDLKLSLYSLQEITDEDAIEVAKMAISADGMNVAVNAEIVQRRDDCISVKIGRENHLLVGIYIRTGDVICRMLDVAIFTPTLNMVRITDYLRSKGYDCGYAHIKSLIEAGLAVKLVRDEK